MVFDDAQVGVDVATDKQIVRFGFHAVVVMQNKEVLLLIDSSVRWSLTGYARPPRGCIRQSALAVALFSLTRWRCPCTAAHYGGLGLLLVVSYEFRMILFLLLAEDHEEDGGNADDDADEDVNRQRFAKDQCADQDCRYGFESAQNRRFSRTDKACGKGYRQHGYHSREDSQADEIQHVRSGVYALQHRCSVNKQVCQKSDSAYHQAIEREHVFGDMFDTLRAVDDHQIDGITQSGHRRENNAEPVNLSSGGGPTEQNHSRNRGGYRQPYLPFGIDMQADHDKRHKDRIQINERRRQPRRNEPVRLEEKDTAGGEQTAEHNQQPHFPPVDAERLMPERHPET